MSLVILGGACAVAAAIYLIVTRLAVGEWIRAFKAIWPA